MAKERSRGITVFGVICILLGIYSIYVLWNMTSSYLIYRNSIYRHLKDAKVGFDFKVSWVLYSAYLSFPVLSSGIFNLKPWAGKAILFLSSFCIILHILIIISTAVEWWSTYPSYCLQSLYLSIVSMSLFLSMIYYFTRPKVKQQFKA